MNWWFKCANKHTVIYSIALKQKQRKGRQHDVIFKQIDVDVFSVWDIMLFNNEHGGSMTHRNTGVNPTKARKLCSGIIFGLMKLNRFQLSPRQLYSLRDENFRRHRREKKQQFLTSSTNKQHALHCSHSKDHKAKQSFIYSGFNILTF